MTTRNPSRLADRHDERVTHRGVTAGRVICPRRGRIDVVTCFLCDLGRGLSDGPVERVLCSWRDEAMPADDEE